MAGEESEHSTTGGIPAVASPHNGSTETTAVSVDENSTAEGRNSPVMGVWKPPVIPEHPEGAEIRRQVSLPQAASFRRLFYHIYFGAQTGSYDIQ
jgi:hypothetical protein